MKNKFNIARLLLILSVALISAISSFFIFHNRVFSQEYTHLYKFEGSGDKNTDIFQIKSDRWQIIWKIVPANEYKVMNIGVYEEGNEFPIESVSSAEKNEDTTVIHKGPGKFYLKVTAANLKSWSISVEGGPLPKPETTDQQKSTNASQSTSDNKKDNKSCFIATAVYDTNSGEKLDTLRNFRNDKLLTNKTGSNFVNLYYKNSPPAASFISLHPTIKYIIREAVIDPVVWILKK